MSRPLYFANAHLQAYSVQTLAEATSFVQDLKLGHYIKIPPRATFLGVFVDLFLGFDCLLMLYGHSFLRLLLSLVLRPQSS